MSEVKKPISEVFGSKVYDLEKMRQSLPGDVLKRVLKSMDKGERLDPEAADTVATSMKNWAVDNGCTHYTHWFQPMTGFTAEKHDSFIEHSGVGKVIESFSGKQLIQGEPDASSFPSGGIRSTFEARGYTIWDPTSPAFIMEYPTGNTLCIPSVFVSYTGETLDKKAPLLKSNQALNAAALEIMRLFNQQTKGIVATLGVEQEYFLIDRKTYEERPDLMQAGRTLFGLAPSKHQQMEDQYFGHIPERAFAFMADVADECYRIGIPLKTRHNEVAPNQFEFAQLFEEANLAVDHNQMLMDVMQRVAKRHHLAVMFHEKPFAGVNGSGKHCNWSMATAEGDNLLNPGRTPRENLRFLVFLVATIKAVHDHAKELRASITSSGNDLRLGANEAPPAIISVFLGDLLSRVLGDLEHGRVTENTEEAWISVGIDRISAIPKDNTDRNRTSPFAFTSNKFEFRAVGGSATPATAITVLNTAVASKLMEAKVRIEGLMAEKKDFNAAVVETVRRMYTEAKNVCFEGDNYSAEWVQEAQKRGLPNLRTTPEALTAIPGESSVNLFTHFHVYDKRELEARFHINMENYIKQMEIEGQVTARMASIRYLPAAMAYLRDVGSTIREVKGTLGDSDGSVAILTEKMRTVSGLVQDMQKGLNALHEAMKTAHGVSDLQAQGMAFAGVREKCGVVRAAVDKLEEIVSSDLWPVPKYTDMLLKM